MCTNTVQASGGYYCDGVFVPVAQPILAPVDFNDSLQVTQAVLAGNTQALAEQAAYDKAALASPANLPALVISGNWDPYLTYLASTQNPGGCVENGTGVCATGYGAKLPTPGPPPAYNPGAGIVTASGLAPDGKSPSNTAFQHSASGPSSAASGSGVQATGVLSGKGIITSKQSTSFAASAGAGPVNQPSGHMGLLIVTGLVIAFLVLK